MKKASKSAKSRSKSKSKSKSKKGRSLLSAPKFSKRNLVVFGLIFALVAAFFIYQAFAASGYVNYYGTLKPSNPSATYKLTTGSGVINIAFTNNTADVTLKIRASDGTLVGRLDSRGRKAVKLSSNVKADTYTITLTTKKAFNTWKGYSAKIHYPIKDTASPTVIIKEPFNKESISGTSKISAIAEDDIKVTKVDMFVNDTIIKNDKEAPWDTRWDTRKFEDGVVTVVVKAYDEAGNVGEASGTILIDNIEDQAEAAQSRFPGDPNPRENDKSYWGSSIGGNADPARHESPTGASLSVRRTFHQWSHVTNMSSSMYRIVEDDLDNDRLPFISFKTPGWKDMGDGKYNKQIDAMLRKLDSYDQPIWLVAHHEPEGGGASGNTPDDPGGPAQWRRMQTKIRERINAVGTTNIAFMPVVMTYTWNPASNRNPDDWWVDGIWDAYCVDHYNYKESTDILDKSWNSFMNWSDDKDIPICIGEWGNRGTNTAAGQEMRDFWNWTFDKDIDMIAYAYFDSGLNSPSGSWELKGEQFNVFQDILKNDDRVQRISELE